MLDLTLHMYDVLHLKVRVNSQAREVSEWITMLQVLVSGYWCQFTKIYKQIVLLKIYLKTTQIDTVCK